MTDLRLAARDRECCIRIPGVCNHDPATSVLCHYRIAGLSGIGMKPIDLVAAIGCSSCHSAVDRRSHIDLDYDYVRHMHLEGIARTLDVFASEGLVKW